jgi:hypothetical protein
MIRYTNIQDFDKADRILDYMETTYPVVAEKTGYFQLSFKGKYPCIRGSSPHYPDVDALLNQYRLEKNRQKLHRSSTRSFLEPDIFISVKSKSALTAFSAQWCLYLGILLFLHTRQHPRWNDFTSIEAGWYFGGIYGAGQEAKFYNERLYERLATPMMNEKPLFPDPDVCNMAFKFFFFLVPVCLFSVPGYFEPWGKDADLKYAPPAQNQEVHLSMMAEAMAKVILVSSEYHFNRRWPQKPFLNRLVLIIC